MTLWRKREGQRSKFKIQNSNVKIQNLTFILLFQFLLLATGKKKAAKFTDPVILCHSKLVDPAILYPSCVI